MALFKKTKDQAPKEAVVKTTLVPRDEANEKPAEKNGKLAVKAAVKKRYSVPDHLILVKPIISEKTFRMNISGAKYVFQVSCSANKLDIKKAFFNVYGLMPQSIHVMRGGGDVTRFGRTQGTTKLWKKAIVTLKKGEKLEDF